MSYCRGSSYDGLMGVERVRRFLHVLVRGVALVSIPVILLSAYVLYDQERFIFPGLYLPKSVGAFALFPGVRAVTIETSDNESLQAFTTVAEGTHPPFVALIFHGNGETAETQNFIPFFKKVGIPALTFDYRGFGHSSGWPSEEGIYRDAEAAAEKVRELTGLPYSRFVVLGNSIGSGPAAYIAGKIQPRALILIAGFKDFGELVGGIPPYSFLRFGLRYQFPVTKHLEALTGQCVVLAHGKRDQTIPFWHLSQIAKALPATTSVSLLESEIAGHNDIFYKVEDQLIEKTKACLGMQREDSPGNVLLPAT